MRHTYICINMLRIETHIRKKGNLLQDGIYSYNFIYLKCFEMNGVGEEINIESYRICKKKIAVCTLASKYGKLS